MPSKNSAPFVHFELTPRHANAVSCNDLVLGLHCIGARMPPPEKSLPIQHIAIPLLDTDDHLCELWRTNQPCRDGQFRGIVFRASDAVLFGVVDIDETAFRANAETSALCAAAERAYRDIFALLEAEGFPYLWRAWNYLPDIHAEEGGLERYRQFNIGRHRAFEMCGRSVDSSPAASALGTRDGTFSVAFIAGRSEPARIENPRQISAFAYPRQYGPRSPTFSRAVAVDADAHQALFVSGTASIIGHETVHPDDVVAQTRETIANLAALLEQANLRARSTLYTLQTLAYRVYIRRAEDYAAVRDVIAASIGAALSVTYVQAEICRQDLLVEIEAFAVAPRA